MSLSMDFFKKNKRSLDLLTSLPVSFQICSEILFNQTSTTYVLFLIQGRFKVIQKITLTNLCKTYRDVIIVIFFNFHFEWKRKRG